MRLERAKVDTQRKEPRSALDTTRRKLMVSWGILLVLVVWPSSTFGAATGPIPLSFASAAIETVVLPSNGVAVFSGDVADVQRVIFYGGDSDFVVRDGYLWVGVPSDAAPPLLIMAAGGRSKLFLFTKTATQLPASYLQSFQQGTLAQADNNAAKEHLVLPTHVAGDLDGDLQVTYEDIVLGRRLLRNEIAASDVACFGAADGNGDGLLSQAEFEMLFPLSRESTLNHFFLRMTKNPCLGLTAPFFATGVVAPGESGYLYLLDYFKTHYTLTVTPHNSSDVAATSEVDGAIKIDPSSSTLDGAYVPLILTLAHETGALTFQFGIAVIGPEVTP